MVTSLTGNRVRPYFSKLLTTQTYDRMYYIPGDNEIANIVKIQTPDTLM